jgi:hypothetical protein
MGVGSGMLLLQDKVEAYLLEQGRVPWGEDIEQWDNPLLVGVWGMVFQADCLDKACQVDSLDMHFLVEAHLTSEKPNYILFHYNCRFHSYNCMIHLVDIKTSLVPRRYVLFYGLHGLCVGRVDQFDRSVFLPRVPSHVRT